MWKMRNKVSVSLAIEFQRISIWLSEITSSRMSQVHAIASETRMFWFDISLLGLSYSMTFKTLDFDIAWLSSGHFVLGEWGQRSHHNWLSRWLLHRHIQLRHRLVRHHGLLRLLHHHRLLYHHRLLHHHSHLRLLNQTCSLNPRSLDESCVIGIRPLTTCFCLYLASVICLVIQSSCLRGAVIQSWKDCLFIVHFHDLTRSHSPPVRFINAGFLFFWSSHSTLSERE